MNYFSKRNGFVSLWLVGILLVAQAVWAHDDDDIERIFFFGDSLTDSGNIFALLGTTAQPPWPIIPSAPYAFADFQFSNGRTWARRFAKRLGTRRSGKASLFNPGKNGNYAFGGARAHTGAGDPTSAASQINRYLADFNQQIDADALYVLQFGGNDVRDALLDPPNSLNIVLAAVTAEIEIIKRLRALGVKNFLVADVPNLGLTPAIRLIPGAAEPATDLSRLYNAWLEAGLKALETGSEFAPAKIKRLSFFDILNDVVGNPARFRFRNTTDTCLMVLPPATDRCNKPRQYVFWDGIHPTKKVHRIVAKVAAGLYDD